MLPLVLPLPPDVRRLNISGRMLKTIPVQSIKENNPDFHPQDLKVIVCPTFVRIASAPRTRSIWQDCSHNNIQFLPANILFWAVELRRINASHNEMTEIPVGIVVGELRTLSQMANRTIYRAAKSCCCWIYRITNSHTFRQFSNVWAASRSLLLTITI